MYRKGFSQFLVLAGALILVAVAIALYFVSKRPITAQNVISQLNVTTSTQIIPSSTFPNSAECTTSFGDFDAPPPPKNTMSTGTDYVWIPITSGNIGEFYALSSEPSLDATKIIYPRAFNATSTLNSALPGKGWVSPTGNLDYLNANFYGPILRQEGWIHSAWVSVPGGGVQLNSEASGYIKVENGYFRSVVLSDLDGSPSYDTSILIFESDIVPLSGIVPGFQPICPILTGNFVASSTTLASTAWLNTIRKTSQKVVVVPSFSSIPQAIQGGVVYLQNGDIWVANQDGGNPLKLTQTNGHVNNRLDDGDLIFTFSPDYHYLVYFTVGVGNSIANNEIDVLDLYTNQVIQKINGGTLHQFSVFSQDFQYQTPRVNFEEWITDDQFIYGAWGDDPPGGGTDQYGHLLVDLQKGTTTVVYGH
jgi:hypothetical protein